ncbi:Transmembrane protein 39A [Xenoophorus captivus]|uniref:Transmembrane protein 39A n=1 Tax=Xenoophorus captivus TaxID=1517983 RepID=A0ABV0Q7C1_9TELE
MYRNALFALISFRSSNSVGLSAPPISALITPEPVRHSRIPELPLDSSFLFEFLLFLYLLVALFVQYINIYRAVWWYPYSHPAASTSLVSQSSGGSLLRYIVLIAARLSLLTMCGWVLCWTLVNLCRNHSVLNLLFLGYPFGVYVPLCCFHQEGGKSPASGSDCEYPADPQQANLTESPFLRPRDFLFLLRENIREQFSSPPHMPSHACPQHIHSDTPELIRGEVEELKSDFNRRIKEVLFNSLFSAYYVAFLPLCFVKVGVFAFVLMPAFQLYNKN